MTYLSENDKTRLIQRVKMYRLKNLHDLHIMSGVNIAQLRCSGWLHLRDYELREFHDNLSRIEVDLGELRKKQEEEAKAQRAKWAKKTK